MNRDPKSLKGPYRDLVPKIGTLFLTGHGILWRKVLKYGVFLQQSRKQAILSRKCRHTRSGNEILEHLGPIYTWKISLKYRDILHQIEISLKYRVYRKKQYRSGVVKIVYFPPLSSESNYLAVICACVLKMPTRSCISPHIQWQPMLKHWAQLNFSPIRKPENLQV